MTLAAGTRIGPYEVGPPLGAGGMGEVYRATDTTLGRQVAIKILPHAFAVDPDRLMRFEREARTLASLNHPNIAAIYGFEKSAGSHALVMELIEGEDLSARIRRGRLPLEDTLPIARQIAEALEAAHEQGIIHRDLKPANIKVRPDGTVKVLDFGLAKALDPAIPSDADSMNSPTITSPAMTARGVILGTAAYMAPEQAKGKLVDRRADVWAFGAVLYEMLTGQRAFAGEDIADTIVAVLSKEPDWSALPPGTPAPIGTLLRRCLQKDRRRRLDSAAAVRLEIDDAIGGVDSVDVRVAPKAGGLLPRTLTATLGAALVLGLFVWSPWRRAERPPATRVDIVTPATDEPASLALSPDGRQIVFVAPGDGASRLWLRSLAATTAQPLPGTEGATFPFWSPDNRSIAFFAANALKRIDLGGGAPQTLVSAPVSRGGTWSADGVIVFSGNDTGPLMRVSPTGGAAVAVTALGPGETGHRYPHLLPDGNRLLFLVRGTADRAGIFLGALDGRAPVRLTAASGSGVYLPSGWLLWVQAGALVAQQLDLAHAALEGEPIVVADGVEASDSGRSAVSAAETGLLAYRGGFGRQQQLTWVDRSGSVRGTLGTRDGNGLSMARVSPDGRRAVVTRTVQGNRDLWLLDSARMSRFTLNSATDDVALWSPDGTGIAFRSNRTGSYDLYQKLSSGAGAEQLILASNDTKAPTSWSRDGRFLLFHTVGGQTLADLWVAPMVGDRTPRVLLETPYAERWGAFSPDGRWVAYQSDESDRMEVYVRPFVQPTAAEVAPTVSGAQWQISTAGGIHPAWRPDGKELYYLNPAGEMMAATIAIDGSILAPGTPVRLFPTRIFGGGVDSLQGRQYDVGPDGLFLINTVAEAAATPITLLMNWSPEAKN